MMKQLTLAALAACGLAAQSGSTAGQIRLTVAAMEANGEPAEDLKASDLQITDQGKPQKISFFTHMPAAEGAPLGPKEFSNRIGKAAPHSTVILFDLLNEIDSDRLSTWHLLAKSLSQLESGENVYFYVLTLEGNLEPIHAISKGEPDDKTWTQGFEKTLDKAMKKDMHALPAQMRDIELVVKKTYVAMETLGQQMLTMPGRRDIVWVTTGMPNVWNTKNPCNGDWVDCALYVPHLAVTLASANVAVNPVTYTNSPNPNVARDLEQLAGLTGGWTYTGEDMRAVLKEIGRDATHYYSVVYDTQADNWDQKFHKIRVTSDRKSLKLRSKTRYYAFPDKRSDGDRQGFALRQAFQAMADEASIGLRATLAPGADAKAVKVLFKVDANSLMFTESGGKYTCPLTYLIEDLGASGPTGEPMIMQYPVSLTQDQYTAALKDGIPMQADHLVADAVQKLRVIVLDANQNVAGSLTIPAR
jgi:VWFA-related protein